jgi:hypothetical protein
MKALVVHLATTEEATVVEVEDDGRRVVAVTASGERIVFTLRRATGRFHAGGHGPRLKLLP